MKPMLAEPITELPSGDRWVVEPKVDGWRAIATVYEDGEVELTTRTANLIATVPYLNAVVAQHFAPGTILDGEIVGPSNGIDGWGKAQGDLTRTSAVQQSGDLVYVVFDVVSQGGVDLQSQPLEQRREAMVEMFAAIQHPNLALIEQEPLAPEVHERHLEQGYEGSMVKNKLGRYRQNSRSGGWYKIKPQAEAEATAIGFYEATPGSKYEGWAVGGIRFRLPGGYEGKAAGMTDAERAEMFKAQAGEIEDRWTGNVIELRHHGVTRDGALRHPQYQRVRDPLDKAVADSAGDTAVVTRPRKTAVVREARVPQAGEASSRNYAAMKDAKLLTVIAQLQDGGDAWERVIAGGYDPQADMEKAWAVAVTRGIV